MKSLLKRLILGISLGVIGFAYSQKIDKTAKNILDETSKYYKSKNNIYFKFTYGMGKSGKISKNHTGIFYASKEKYNLKIMDNEQIFDGKKVYNINKEDMEITIAKPDNKNDIISPISYIESYKTGYNINYIGNKNNIDMVRLSPVKNNGISHIVIHINKTKKQITKIEQVYNNKDITTITINDYKENIKVTPSIFTFNKNLYKNYLITEL